MIVHVVGNRPQFVKLSPVYRALEGRGFRQIIIHSGQHYDKNMSDIFFEELGIPSPYINLRVGSGSHAEITGNTMIKLEAELVKLMPELLIVYGDTDTSAAAAITARKLNIKIAHVEGGLRTGSQANPEEINRIIVDHLSSMIFCPDISSLQCTRKEGLGDKSYLTGDVMYDTYLQASSKVEPSDSEIILMTWHRQENTSDKRRMQSILNLIGNLPMNVVCPMHPRTVVALKEHGLWDAANAIPNYSIIEPVGYFEMVSLMNKARVILTDSGGLSKESSFAGAKCLFFLNLNVWEDLSNIGWITLINPEKEQDVNEAINICKTSHRYSPNERPHFYGEGDASIKIAEIIELSQNSII